MSLIGKVISSLSLFWNYSWGMDWNPPTSCWTGTSNNIFTAHLATWTSYEPFTLWEPPLCIQPMIRTFDWERLQASKSSSSLFCPSQRESVPLDVREVALVVQSHLIKKSTPTFGPLLHKHVEYGIAHLRDDHQGEIIEPLPFLSIVRWLKTQKDLCLEANLSHQLANTDYHGHTFEGVVIRE